MRKVFLLLVASVLVALPAMAQVDTGSISGTIHDPSGAVVVGANVTVTNLGTQAKRTTTSNTEGLYTVTGLPAGRYEVVVSNKSFATYKAQIQVTVGSRNTLDASLKVGDASTSVEVVAESVAAVNTQNQEVSQVITPEQIQQLPSLTRNPYDFVGTVGNVSSGDRMGSANDQNTGTRGAGFVINGQRSSGTEILLDGAENIDLFSAVVGQSIPQDAVGEYRVITNNFEAQYGRASGGILNVVTKGGTNNYHGTGWEYNRLSAYTANTYDNAVNGVAKGKYTRNQFGYTFGGPIIKDKLFFFQSTEWLRVRSNAVNQALVPNPTFLGLTKPNVQQYFSKWGAGMNAPVVGTITKTTKTLFLDPDGKQCDNPPAANCTSHDFPFVGSAKGAEVGTPGALLAGLPDGTPIFDQVAYTAPLDAGGGSPQNTYQLVGKVDYNMTDKTQMSFRYGLQKNGFLSGSAFSSPYPQYAVGQDTTNNAFLYSVTHTFTPNVLSSTRFSATRQNTSQSYDAKLQNAPTLYLKSGASINGVGVQLPGFFDNQTGVGGLPYGGPQNVFQLNQDLSWVKGVHTLRFGGQFNYEQINRGYGAYAQAIELLGKNEGTGIENMLTGNLYQFQVAINPQGKFPCQRDPLTNTPIATSDCTLSTPLDYPVFSRSYRYKDWAAYAQDSWRVSHRLTLNYGLRYEFYGVQHNSNPQLDSNLYYGSGSNLFAQLRNGKMQLAPNSPNGRLWDPSYGTFAPRIGFAWDVTGDGKTSLRGGYGISYERNFGNVTFNMIQNPPNYAGVQLTSPTGVVSTPGLAGPVTTDNLGPLGGAGLSVPLPPSSPRNVYSKIKVAQTQMWSLSLERTVAKNTVLGVDYNGAHGVHLYDIKNVNMLGGGNVWLGDPLVSTTACLDAFGYGPCYTRPNEQWTSVNQRGSQGFSHYNALNLRLQSSNLFHQGLMLITNYTYAHSQDNISSTFSEAATASNGVGNLGYLNPMNPGLDYGNSDFDIRHRLVVTAVWDLPYAKGMKGVAKQILDGWSIIPMFQARTGAPFSIVDSTNCLNCGNGGMARYTPVADKPITNYSTGSGPLVLDDKGNPIPNDFGILTLPAADNWGDPALGGISDFGVNGVYPTGMTRRNAFKGPGAWNADFAIGKTFKVTERVGLTFRAEGFNIFNHHNMYVNGYVNDVFGTSGPFTVTGKKGGLGSLAGASVVSGSPADERRFGQFALRISF